MQKKRITEFVGYFTNVFIGAKPKKLVSQGIIASVDKI